MGLGYYHNKNPKNMTGCKQRENCYWVLETWQSMEWTCKILGNNFAYDLKTR